MSSSASGSSFAPSRRRSSPSRAAYSSPPSARACRKRLGGSFESDAPTTTSSSRTNDAPARSLTTLAAARLTRGPDRISPTLKGGWSESPVRKCDEKDASLTAIAPATRCLCADGP